MVMNIQKTMFLKLKKIGIESLYVKNADAKRRLWNEVSG
jgi:hypothetical protein